MQIEQRAKQSPLECFVRDYVDTAGGVWEEVEPQVYDVLLPWDDADREQDLGGREIVRIAFDPEAVREHPGSQLASYGTPLIDRLFASAIQRGCTARGYVSGLNTSPHGIGGRVRRALQLPQQTELQIGRIRPLNFPQAVFWFQTTFVSDQKEYQILPEAIDLYSDRPVRHLDRLLDESRLSPEPSLFLPDVSHHSLFEAYARARAEATRTLGALANVRYRELNERVELQLQRMARYYADLRSELAEQLERAHDASGEMKTKIGLRREVLEREQQLRMAELRSKSSLHLELKLLNLLVVHQPKLLLETSIIGKRLSPAALPLVWDPLTDSLEAAACPQCKKSTFIFQIDRRNKLACPNCPTTVIGS